MGLGDVPTWAAAVAAWAGVVVNAPIVFVALSPIRTAKRQHAARGRLVAAYLSEPIGNACKLMCSAREDLNTLLKPDALPEGTELDDLLIKMENVRDWVPPMLGSFNLSEAAYLGEGMGENLAQAIGCANAVLAALSIGLEAFHAANKFSTMDKVLDARRRAARLLGFLPAEFDSTARQLFIFAEYCERLFPPPRVRSGES